MKALGRGYILMQKSLKFIFRSMNLIMSAFTDICNKIREAPFRHLRLGSRRTVLVIGAPPQITLDGSSQVRYVV